MQDLEEEQGAGDEAQQPAGSGSLQTKPRPVGREQRILLIGGAMRSGTTVIHRALCTASNSNPYISESWFLRDLISVYRASLPRYELRFEDQFGALRNFDQLVRINVQYYTSMVSARYGDPEVLIFKHPELVKHFIEFAALFPKMLFLAIVRDPRDVIASMKRIRDKHVAEGLTSPISGLATIEALCLYYADYYERLIKYRRGMGNRIWIVRYEDVMRDPKKEIERIGKFCGARNDLDKAATFDADLAGGNNLDKEFRELDRISSAFWSDLYTKDLSPERIGRYSDVLDASEAEEVQVRLKAMGQAFKYW